MRVLFIKPPQTYLADPDRNPPLGLMYVAVVVKDMGCEVEYADFSTYEEDGMDFLAATRPADVYAFSVSILDYEFCHKLAGQLKERDGGLVVFGGVFPTTSPEFIDFRVVDAMIKGEGETSFRKIIEDIRKTGAVKKQYSSLPIENLDEIPFPLREGIKFISHKLLKGGLASTTIITSRGCPYDCAFCASKTIWGKTVRFRSVGNVVAEVDDLIHKHGVQGLRFQDDTLTLRVQRFKALCHELGERHLLWRCSTRSNLVTKELAELMKRSGCVEVGIGVESADPLILKMAHKAAKVEDHERAIHLLKGAGIEVACFFICGLPGENARTPDINIDFIKRTSPNRVFCTTLMPYPGTVYWNEPEKFQLNILHRDLKRYNQVSGVGEEDRDFVAIPAGMTLEQLHKNRKRMIDFLTQERKIR